MPFTSETGKKYGKGRPKGSRASHTIKAETAKAALVAKYIAEANSINQALVNKAKDGDIAAIREIHDRIWGKSSQSLEVAGKDGNAIEVDVKSVIHMSDMEVDRFLKDKLNASTEKSSGK